MGLIEDLIQANRKAKVERDNRRAARLRTDNTGDQTWEDIVVVARNRLAALLNPTGGALSLILLLLVLFPLGLLPIRPDAFVVQQIMFIMQYILVVSGLNIIAGYTGQLSLGQGIFTSLGAYTAAILATKAAGTIFGEPWIAFIVAVFVGAVVGAVLGIPSLRVKGAFLAVVTLAFVPIFETIYKYPAFSKLFGGLEGISDIPSPVAGNLEFFGYTVTDVDWYYVHIAFVVVMVFFIRNIIRSRIGRSFMAIRESEIAAKACGINVVRTKTTAFMLASVYASMAGVLYVHTVGFVSPTFPSQILESFRYVVMLIVGGTGSLFGPVVGATSITLFTRLTAEAVEYQQLILGGLAIFTVATAPYGLVGVGRDIAHKVVKMFGRSVGGRARAMAKTDAMRSPLHRQMTIEIPEIIEAKSMSKIFGGLRANDSVDMAVRKGSVHSLIGPNGSGKTTFINTVTGIYTADEGKVDFIKERSDNRPVFINVGRGMGRTFQNLQLWRRMSVLDNVLVGLHTRMRSGLFHSILRTPRQRREEAQGRERAIGLLEFCGIAEYADLPAGQLPYGPSRLLEIARALALDPIFLLLDEPAAGLNPAESASLTQLIRNISGAGITVFLIEHHMDIVMAVSDRISVFDFGQKIAEGTPQEIQSNPRVLEAYLGEEAPSDA